jgi:hypothetical protein
MKWFTKSANTGRKATARAIHDALARIRLLDSELIQRFEIEFAMTVRPRRLALKAGHVGNSAQRA